MITIAIILVLLLIAELFTAQQEIIMLRPEDSWFPDAPWWTSFHYEYKNKFVNWLAHYPLSFLRDGWHFCKSVWSTIYLVIIVILLGQMWYWVVIYYTVCGTLFNVFYDLKSTIKNLKNLISLLIWL